MWGLFTLYLLAEIDKISISAASDVAHEYISL